MNTLKALKRCSLGLDLYLWLTYRTFTLKRPLRLSWQQVYKQFGADPDKASDKRTIKFFRRKVLREAGSRVQGMKTSPWLIAAFAAVLAGCSGDNGGSPVGPSQRYPQVAGTYTGPATITVLATGVTIITGSGRAVVVQSGNELTINESLTFVGVTFVLPAVTGTISETGFFTITASGAVPSPPTVSVECGVFTLTSQSLTFAGRTLTFQEGYQTTFCGSLIIAAILDRP